MNICDNKGHKYYPTVRRVQNWLATTEENILYCSRCGEVKNLDQPYISYSPFWGKSGGITVGPTTTTGWMYLSGSTRF